MLEDVDADDGVELVADEFGAIAFLEMTGAKREPRVSLHRVLQPGDAIDVRLQADHEIRRFGQRAAHRPDARSHFEDALADVIPKQIEEVRAVSPRLLHRFQVVGRVAFLGLIVPSIDVIRVSHGLWHGTIPSRERPKPKAQSPKPRAFRIGVALRREWVPAALSLLVYTIITAIIGRDVLAHLGSTIANDAGDPLLTAAILKWNATHLPLTDAWYQLPIFYPTRDTLTFSEHLLGLSVIASPLYWLTGDIVITYNLVLLLTFPLCGIAMYALVDRLTGSEAGAFIAGLAFAFAPYRISQLPHIQMLATFWAPLALLGLHVYLQSGRRRWLALYGAGWALQGAANGYALVMFSILVGLWVLWFVVMSRKWHALLMIGLASLAAFVPLAPVLYTYATVHNYYGFVRDYWEIRTFSADIAALLCAPPSLTFWAWLRVKCGPEGALFPGAALMLLSVLGIIGIAVRTWRSTSVQSGRAVTYARRFLLFVASVYAVVIAVLLLWGPFMFSIGPLRVQASTYRKPVQVIVLTLVLALVLSPGGATWPGSRA